MHTLALDDRPHKRQVEIPTRPVDRNFEKARVKRVGNLMQSQMGKIPRQLAANIAALGDDVFRPFQCKPLGELHDTLAAD